MLKIKEVNVWTWLSLIFWWWLISKFKMHIIYLQWLKFYLELYFPSEFIILSGKLSLFCWNQKWSVMSQTSLHVRAVWPGCILLSCKLQVLILISLKIILISSDYKGYLWNVNWVTVLDIVSVTLLHFRPIQCAIWVKTIHSWRQVTFRNLRKC